MGLACLNLRRFIIMVCLTLLTIAAITFPSLISQLLTAATLLLSGLRVGGSSVKSKMKTNTSQSSFSIKGPFQIIRTIKSNIDDNCCNLRHCWMLKGRVTTSTKEDATKITTSSNPLFLTEEEDGQQQTTQVATSGKSEREP